MAASMKNDENMSAMGWKERGNMLLKVGQLKEAEQCYGKSIGVEGTSVAYANR